MNQLERKRLENIASSEHHHNSYENEIINNNNKSSNNIPLSPIKRLSSSEFHNTVRIIILYYSATISAMFID
jgi:hypothetical protein